MANQENLLKAIHETNIEGCKAAIAGGADVNQQGLKGNTPLHAAIGRYFQSGVHLNAEGELYAPNSQDHFEVVRLLRDNGAKDTIANDAGVTPKQLFGQLKERLKKEETPAMPARPVLPGFTRDDEDLPAAPARGKHLATLARQRSSVSDGPEVTPPRLSPAYALRRFPAKKEFPGMVPTLDDDALGNCDTGKSMGR